MAPVLLKFAAIGARASSCRPHPHVLLLGRDAPAWRRAPHTLHRAASHGACTSKFSCALLCCFRLHAPLRDLLPYTASAGFSWTAPYHVLFAHWYGRVRGSRVRGPLGAAPRAQSRTNKVTNRANRRTVLLTSSATCRTPHATRRMLHAAGREPLMAALFV